MDDPSLDRATHQQALAGLRRVNWWSRTDSVIWNALKTVQPKSIGEPLRILDVGSGGGDLLCRLAGRFAGHGIPAVFTGWDISLDAVQYATEQARLAAVNNVSFEVHDCLNETFPEQKFDVVMCSLFLHHLDEHHAVSLLNGMKLAASQLVLVDDLVRSKLGYWLAWAGCRVLTRCHIVHIDGPLSVEGAFTTSEALKIADYAGLAPCRITRHWPQRFLLQWSRSN